MESTRLRQALATLTAAAVLASMTVATVASPASAAKPKCQGKTATIVGTRKGERIVGTARRDVIVAKGGADRIFGRGGHDLICAGAGNDKVVGNAGIDKLIAGAGADKLFGGAGPDRLFGGPGPDVLAGQPGNDVLDGGIGVDTCYQGLGSGPVVRGELPAAPVVPVVPVAPSLIALEANDILAVAYSDIDGLNGYSTGDVLIAKLVDTDPGGVPTIGDTIETSGYPRDIAATLFGDWGLKSHVITGIDNANSMNLVVRTASATHFWSDFGSSDVYGESGTGLSRFQDGEEGSSVDQLSVALGSPSQPSTMVDISTPGNAVDDPFLDVGLNYDAP